MAEEDITVNKSYFYSMDTRQGWNYTTFLSFWNDFYRHDEMMKYAEFSSIVILSTISIVVNCLLIAAFCLKKGLRSNQSRYTIAVMVTSVVYIPFCIMIGAARLTYGWTFGDVGCKLVMWATVNTAFMKILLMAMLSVDRYMKVVRGSTIKYRITILSILLCILIPSIAVFVMVYINVFTQRIDYGEEHFDICTAVFKYHPVIHSSLAYFCALFATFFVLPVILIIFCYNRILAAIAKSAKSLLRHASIKGAQLRSNKAKNRTTRVLIIIVVLFVLMWTPFFAGLAFLSLDHLLESFKLSSRVLIAVICIHLVNTIIEPFLYAFTSQVVRRELLKCCQRRNAVNSLDDTLNTMNTVSSD